MAPTPSRPGGSSPTPRKGRAGKATAPAGGGRPRATGSGGPQAQTRQEAASRRMAGQAQKLRGEQRETSRQRRDAALRDRRRQPVAAGHPVPPESGLGIRTTALLLRFVSCGIFALALGLTWKLTLAPRRLGVGSTALGALFLLGGFVIGGILWYVRDARLRQRHPQLVSDERIIFSFVVFAAMPFCVLLVLFVVWVVALIIGAG